jgi:hypothetical protein
MTHTFRVLPRRAELDFAELVHLQRIRVEQFLLVVTAHHVLLPQLAAPSY